MFLDCDWLIQVQLIPNNNEKICHHSAKTCYHSAKRVLTVQNSLIVNAEDVFK